MKLQKQPNHWSCLATAFAIVLDVDVEKIFNFIGHDGSEVIWPHLEEPMKRRAFHPRELINYCFVSGFAAIHFDLEAASAAGYNNEEITIYELPPMDERYLDSLMINNHGVLIGRTIANRPHAVAWTQDTIYDPNGRTYALKNNFNIRELYIIRKIKDY